MQRENAFTNHSETNGYAVHNFCLGC